MLTTKWWREFWRDIYDTPEQAHSRKILNMSDEEFHKYVYGRFELEKELARHMNVIKQPKVWRTNA